MAKYYHYLTNYHHRQRHLKRLKRVVLILGIMVLVIAAVIVVDLWRGRSNKQKPISQQTTSIQQSPINVFRTSYFQFQASPSWQSIAEQSTDNKFVYRNLDQDFIQQELDIYVNSTPPQLTADYVVPVAATPGGGLAAQNASPHCKNGLPPGSRLVPTVETYDKVTFTCIPDETYFYVLAGMENGTPSIKLIRPSGAAATYIFVFFDNTVSPSAGQLEIILNSFQTR